MVLCVLLCLNCGAVMEFPRLPLRLLTFLGCFVGNDEKYPFPRGREEEISRLAVKRPFQANNMSAPPRQHSEQQQAFLRQANILRKNLNAWDGMLHSARGEDWPSMLGRLNAAFVRKYCCSVCFKMHAFYDYSG